MKIENGVAVTQVRNRQRGQTFVMVAILLPVLLGMAALVIDLGYIYVSYQQLIAATQAAALAGGGAIPNTAAPTATTAAFNYSGLSLNKYPNLKNVSLSVSLACVSPATYPNLGLPPCNIYPSCPSGCNMIQVQETAKVNTFFAKIFGVTSIPMSASAVASARGGGIPPYHIMMVLDATPSMGFGTDPGCTQSRHFGYPRAVRRIWRPDTAAFAQPLLHEPVGLHAERPARHLSEPGRSGRHNDIPGSVQQHRRRSYYRKLPHAASRFGVDKYDCQHNLCPG